MASILFCTLGLSGCSTIKRYFPDKEKDYHYSKEIPPLILPEDLRTDKFSHSNTAQTVAVQPGKTPEDNALADAEVLPEPAVEKQAANPEQGATSTATATDVTQNRAQPENPIAEPALAQAEMANAGTMENELTTKDTKDNEHASSSEKAERKNFRAFRGSKKVQKPEKIRYVIFNDGSNRLQIHEDFDTSWRMVGKAITHNSIEITDHLSAQGQYIVQYDPNEQPYVDGSLWDEVLFFFGDDQNQEREYRIQLLKGAIYTEVLIVDADQQPISEGYALQLLQLLFRTIKADLSDN